MSYHCTGCTLEGGDSLLLQSCSTVSEISSSTFLLGIVELVFRRIIGLSWPSWNLWISLIWKLQSGVQQTELSKAIKNYYRSKKTKHSLIYEVFVQDNFFMSYLVLIMFYKQRIKKGLASSFIFYTHYLVSINLKRPICSPGSRIPAS